MIDPLPNPVRKGPTVITEAKKAIAFEQLEVYFEFCQELIVSDMELRNSIVISWSFSRLSLSALLCSPCIFLLHPNSRASKDLENMSTVWKLRYGVE